MDNITKSFKRFIKNIKELPQKKQYLEFFTALLSIPVLITVIILNFNSLKNINNSKVSPTSSPARTSEEIYYINPSNNTGINKNPTPTSSTTTTQVTEAPCKATIGPISIDSPQEGETVSDNPVQVNVSYPDSSYCAVVWSYRINGGQWSDYDNKSIAIYNPPSGKIKLDLQVKSIVNGNSENLTRNFTYSGTSNNISPIPTSNQIPTPAH